MKYPIDHKLNKCTVSFVFKMQIIAHTASYAQ